VTATATRPHVNAVLDTLRGAGIATGHGTEPDPAPDRYVIVDHDSGQAQPRTLYDSDGALTLELDLSAVGTTAEQALWLADKARSLLSGLTPTIPGRSCHPIRQVGTGPLLRDDDVAPPRFVVIATYRFTSSPA
jgi:hypothetical protein